MEQLRLMKQTVNRLEKRVMAGIAQLCISMRNTQGELEILTPRAKEEGGHP